MKNIIKKTVIFVGFISLFVSCSNYLERDAVTLYKPEQIYTTEAGIEAAVNGMYINLSSGEYYGSSWHGLLNPHSGRMFSSQTASNDATSLNCTPTNTWLLRLWPQMYQTLDSANLIIENVENSKLPNKNTALGQAYFIRAVVNFDLVRLFGSVPLRTKPVTYQNLYIGKSPKADIYKQIIEDFEKAKTLLPDFGQYKKDRPRKWAAYAYLAKVYMQLAGEDGGDPAYWQKAKDEAIQVYGKYTLVSNYSWLFDTTNPFFQENSSESIFEIQYGNFGTVRNGDLVRLYTPGSYAIYSQSYPNTFGQVRANKETFDQHNAQPNDPRIAATYIYNSYSFYKDGGVITQNIYPRNANKNNGFAYIKKWLDPEYTGTTTSRNLTVFRYADLLLMLAEIENEINGPANAYQYVNLVLDRARKSVTAPATPSLQPADYSGLTKEQFRDKIMQERKFELLSEGQDWFDARRRGEQYFIDKTLLLHNNHPKFAIGTDYTYPVAPALVHRNMLLPIPQTEIAANPHMTAADQNPGY